MTERLRFLYADGEMANPFGQAIEIQRLDFGRERINSANSSPWKLWGLTRRSGNDKRNPRLADSSMSRTLDAIASKVPSDRTVEVSPSSWPANGRRTKVALSFHGMFIRRLPLACRANILPAQFTSVLICIHAEVGND